MFYVYLLLLAAKPQFKIGKANDVHARIRGLGVPGDFDLAASQCVGLKTEKDAWRLEKILHRALAKWKLPVDPRNRYSGDTEQFDIACLPRAIQLLVHLADLYDGAVPEPLPAVPPRVVVPHKTLLNYQQARDAARRRDQEKADRRFRDAMTAIACAIDQLSKMRLEVFEMCEEPYKFIAIETSDPELFDRAVAIMGELRMLPFSPARQPRSQSSMITSMTYGWDKAKKRGTATAVVGTFRDFEPPWDPEYLELLDLIPKSQTARVPLDPTPILEAWATWNPAA